MENEQRKKALVTGVGGQDGSYLVELLINKGYEVHGVRRRTSLFNSARIDHLLGDSNINKNTNIILHYADLSDSTSLNRIVDMTKPDEVYNLGAQSHVGISFDVPEYTADVDAIGTLRLLEAIRHICPNTKFYQASSSEMYGKVVESPQKETTPFYPRSPYGVSKVFAYWATKNYRESYNLFTCNGILFNHESPRRGRNFVSRKITRAVARIFLGYQDILYLGNLKSYRDWGHAKDYVEAMYMMMQHDLPGDYVVATGETRTVKEFVVTAFKTVGVDVDWRGEGLNEEGVDRLSGKVIVKIDPLYFRPAEVDYLLGDPTKIKTDLGWQPKTSFKDLVAEMVRFDLRNESKDNGHLYY